MDFKNPFAPFPPRQHNPHHHPHFHSQPKPTSPIKKTNQTLLQKYWNIAKPFWFPEKDVNIGTSREDQAETLRPLKRSRFLLFCLIALALSSTYITVKLSFLEKRIVNSLAERDESKLTYSIVEMVIFILFASTIFSLNHFVEDSLEALWRGWLTNYYLDRYINHNKSFFHLNFLFGKEIDNPDQRLTEDISTFTDKSLKYLVIILNNLLKLFAFSGVLLSISPSLLVFLLCYTSVATWVVMRVFGNKLILLNFLQSKFSANFRTGLIHVRENSESIAFYGGEKEEFSMLWKRLGRSMENLSNLIVTHRNLALFQNLFELMATVLPILFVSPLYFSGQIEIGSVTQTATAFQKILASLGLIIEKLDTFSSFSAGVERLDSLRAALNDIKLRVGTTSQDSYFHSSMPLSQPSTMGGVGLMFGSVGMEEGRVSTLIKPNSAEIELENLRVITPGNRVLIQGLNLSIKKQQSLLVMGPSGNGKSSLLRVIAGLWSDGCGRVTRPPLNQMFFLPQRPYMTLGSLRTNLLYPSDPFHHMTSDDELYHILGRVNLGHVVKKLGGLEVELDLSHILSLGEQQRLAFARILVHKPPIVLIDEATSALDESNERNLYGILMEMGVTVVSIGHRSSLLQYHQLLLELLDNGWNVKQIINTNVNSTPPYTTTTIYSSFSETPQNIE